MQPHQDRPEWTICGDNQDKHDPLNSSLQDIRRGSVTMEGPHCSIISVLARKHPVSTVLRPENKIHLHDFVQTFSEADRVPTLWKGLHHRQQIVLHDFLHDQKAYNDLQDKPYHEQWSLLRMAGKVVRVHHVVFQKKSQSSASRDVQEHCGPTIADSTCDGPKNEAALYGHGFFWVWFRVGFQHVVLHKDMTCYSAVISVDLSLKGCADSHCLSRHLYTRNQYLERFQEGLTNNIENVVSWPDFKIIYNPEKHLGQVVVLLTSQVFTFQVLPYRMMCDVPCNTRFKAHIYENDETMDNNSSKHTMQCCWFQNYPGYHKECTSNYTICNIRARAGFNNPLAKTIEMLTQKLHEDHVTITQKQIISAIVGLTWSTVGVLASWLLRVICKKHQRKVTILKRCKIVQRKRVWKRLRQQSCEHHLECFLKITTRVHYNQKWGPFNEILQKESVTRYRIYIYGFLPCKNRKGRKTKQAQIVIHHKRDERSCQKPTNGLGTDHRHQKIFRRIAFRGIRVGEAKVPGPDSLDIGSFNPTQLYGKEDDVIAWGQGIYCAAETSVTSVALKLLRPKLAQKGFYSVWSEPVEPIQPKFSQLRGKASGTAIISTFPIRQFHEPITSAIEDTCRFVDGVVQLGPNCVAYVASIYGVASSSIALDPIAITNQLFNFAAERAVTFKGPAIIAGDFNCFLSELGGWDKLVQNGWTDSAVLDGFLHNREPQPTSKDAVRKSFVLMNGMLSATLQSCRTCDDHLFPVHPLLLAQCSWQNVICPQLQWVLPKSVDSCIFDKDLLDEAAREFTDRHNKHFQKALSSSIDEAASWMAKAVEHSWKASCVDCEGNLSKLTRGFFGRDKLQPLRNKPPSVPVVRKARDGDFDPGLGQPSIELRRHIRQLRRIESLYSQMSAYNRRPTQEALSKCKQLWNAIVVAPGFTKNFAFWICTNFKMFVPRNLPHIEYVLELKNAFRRWHQSELNKFFLLKVKNRKKSVLLDIAKGGSKCFEEIRDPAPLHQSFVVQNLSLQVRYTAWPKKGKRQIYVYGADQLDVNFPVRFQGQECNIVKIEGGNVTLNKPLRLKNLQLRLEQQQITADPKEMHERTFKAWNEHWQRDCKDPNDDDWDDVIPYLQHVNPVPEMPFEDFSMQLWDKHVKAVKTKTARGGCGFSAKEMLNFPPAILEWLFEIYRFCERRSSWPKNWVLARVSMLAKTAHPTTPFDARPITVFSILYRQWARVRSKQILRHMATYMPREVSMATCRVPADVAAAYIATNVENAINDNKLLAGLGIDLKRCFNTLPRWPLILAMKRMGIPDQYVQGWVNMLECMQRTLWMGSCQSNPQHSTTGAPEGCGFSVVAMAVMSWWQAKTMQVKAKAVDTFTYADNWNYVAEQTRAIIKAVDILKQFVSCMRMEISPSKSWLWATTAKGRKELKNIQVNHETIPVVTSFSDLGCDVQYAKTQKKPKQRKRWERTTRLCKRIQLSKMPRGYKEHIVMASGLSGAIFGAPIAYIPKTKWRTLRSNMAQSLRLATAGASSWLAMGCSLNDPQLKSLGYTLQFWKRFLRMFPNMKQTFNVNMQRPGVSQVGPTACLKKTLRDANWLVITSSVIRHSVTGYQIDWQTASRKYLWFVLERQWSCKVNNEVEHRKDWKSGCVDFRLYAQLTKHRSFRDKWILRTMSAGKHYTNDIICKYSDVTATCPFCDQRDGKEHRLWSCKTFATIRHKHKQTLRKVYHQRDNLSMYALPPMQESIIAWLPTKGEVIDATQIPKVCDVDRFLFLDGTAFGQEFKDLTVSAWAVTEASLNQHDFQLCAKGFVPGLDHSSYRGEVLAIIKGLETIYCGTMYTDCEAALNIFDQLQSCRNQNLEFPVIDHEDLWHCVWVHLCQRPAGCIKILKVKSHQKVGLLDDPHEVWKAAGNNFTDLEAKSVVIQHPIHRHVVAAVNRRKQLATTVMHYHDYVCEIADKSFALIHERRKALRREAEQHMARPNFSYLIPQRVHPPSSMMQWNDLPRYCPYGRTFYNRFATWYTTVQWPIDVTGGTMGYISLLELYFNFVLCTGTETPISNAKRGKPANYQLLDENVLLQTKPWSLGQHSRVWSLFWSWCLKSGVFERVPAKTSNRYLDHVGYSLQSICLEGRPALMHSEATYQAMWSYFHRPEGRRKTTSAPLRPLPRLDWADES